MDLFEFKESLLKTFIFPCRLLGRLFCSTVKSPVALIDSSVPLSTLLYLFDSSVPPSTLLYLLRLFCTSFNSSQPLWTLVYPNRFSFVDSPVHIVKSALVPRRVRVQSRQSRRRLSYSRRPAERSSALVSNPIDDCGQGNNSIGSPLRRI